MKSPLCRCECIVSMPMLFPQRLERLVLPIAPGEMEKDNCEEAVNDMTAVKQGGPGNGLTLMSMESERLPAKEEP